MTGRRTIRLATLLGPNTNDDLTHIALHLSQQGLDVAVVEVDPAPAGVPSALDDAGIGLLWACGLLTAELVAEGAHLEVVAAPVFSGETAAVYRSVIVVRPGEPSRRRRLAVNEFGSWSGYRALFHDAAARRTDRWHPDHMDEIIVTGAHVASIAAVADGRADVAAIDHTIWDWLAATNPAVIAGLVVVDRTVDCPAPPFSLRPGLAAADRAAVKRHLLTFGGPPTVVPASIDDYGFMLG